MNEQTQETEAYQPPPPVQAEDRTVQERHGDWLSSGSVGASAKTIASVMLGRENSGICYPHDSADFGRCLNLLSFVPEWEERLGQMETCPGRHGEVWAALVVVWDNLSKMYEDDKGEAVTAAIKLIIEPIEKASGEVAKLGEGVSMSVGVSMKGSEPDDDMYARAVTLVVREGKATTSFVQRSMQIGYNRAARLIEKMEENGVISAADNTGKRTVISSQADKSDSDKAIDEEQERVDDEKAAKPELPGVGETQDVGGVAGQRLRSFIERVERLEEEKTALMEDIKEIYGEAKGVGFDNKTMRKIVSLRKMDSEKRREADELLDLYRAAIGMV